MAQDRTAERLVAVILTVFFCGFGWLDLLQGGIALKSKSGHVGFADGAWGVAVAAISFMAAAAGVALLARSLGLKAGTTAAMMALVLVPPVLFLVF